MGGLFRGVLLQLELIERACTLPHPRSVLHLNAPSMTREEMCKCRHLTIFWSTDQDGRITYSLSHWEMVENVVKDMGK